MFGMLILVLPLKGKFRVYKLKIRVIYKAAPFLSFTQKKKEEINKIMNWSKVISYANNGVPAPDQIIEKTDREWKVLLTDSQYNITRNKGTEPPGSGEFCSRFETGMYGCVCCKTPLFDSTIKYTSNSGWPSFTEPVKDNCINYIKDTSFGMIRVEVLCNSCQAHLGHVFPDGPEPTGLRYCINSESLQFLDKKTPN